MIGNDIIDRKAVGQRPKVHWDRFREKTMTETEQQLLKEYRKDQLDIWFAWAIKESVYKLEYQLHPQRYFAPKAIEVLELNKARGKFGTYAIQLDWNEDYVHAFAWLSPKKLLQSRIFKKDHSKLDELLLAHLHAAFPERDFCIEKDRFPWIKVDQEASWPLSKSHHGEWLAFSYLMP